MRKFNQTLFIDFETRGSLDLKKAGSHKYCLSPDADMTLCACAFDNEPVRVYERSEIPDKVWLALTDDRVLKVAHNAEFDMCVASYILGLAINVEEWHDTAYQAAYYALPRKLSALAEHLNTTLKASQEELFLFSQPKAKPRGKKAAAEYVVSFNSPDDFPEEWERFKMYAATDVTVMRECFYKMPALPQIEKDAMLETFRMNFNGVPFDTELALRIQALVHEYEKKACEEGRKVYGIANLRSVPQVKAALAKEGVILDTLNIKERGIVTHEILDLRDQSTGAAFRKLPKAFERLCPDGRLRGEFLGYGAHTGRWSSRGVQLQNWARIQSEVSETLDGVRDYGHLRQHLRLCLGHDDRLMFTCADLSQIEARITAYLSGCKWRMDAFANGEDIYSRSAERMFHLPKVDKSMPERQKGKIAELLLGFGGTHSALRDLPEREAKRIVSMWREANPEIVALWHKLERAFLGAVETGKAQIYCNKVLLTFVFDGKTMRVSLPSGRALYYRDLSKRITVYGYGLTYADYGDGHTTYQKIWRGTITENIVQAIARDVLLEAVLRAGRRVPDALCIGSVHDEVWFLHKPDVPMLDIVLDEMARPIAWAQGLVTKGDGFTSDRYRK